MQDRCAIASVGTISGSFVFNVYCVNTLIRDDLTNSKDILTVADGRGLKPV